MVTGEWRLLWRQTSTAWISSIFSISRKSVKTFGTPFSVATRWASASSTSAMATISTGSF